MKKFNVIKLLCILLILGAGNMYANGQKAVTVTEKHGNQPTVSNGWGINQPILEALYNEQKALVAQLEAVKSTVAQTKRARCKQQSQVDKINHQLNKNVKKINKITDGATIIHRYDDTHIGKEAAIALSAEAKMSAFIDSMAIVKSREYVFNEYDDKEAIEEANNRVIVVPQNVITYKVQVAAVRDFKIAPYSILSDISKSLRTDGLWCVYSGEFSSAAKAAEARQHIVSTTPFKDAFVVAFNNGKEISMSEASKLSKE